MDKNSILIVTSEFPPQPGGIGNHAYNLALYLSKNKYRVTVIADQRDVDNTEELAFDAALSFRVERTSLRQLRLIMYLSRIFKTFQQIKKSDYVIASGKFSLWTVAFCSLFAKRPKMAVVHGAEVNFRSFILRKSVDISLKRFDIIVAVSRYTSQLMNHLRREIHVIPNGIDMTQWQIEPQPKLKGNPAITTVGRVSSRKGQLNVVKLLPRLLHDFPEIHYHCIGIPSEAPEIMEHAAALGVADYITFHGVVPDADLKTMLLGSDVFVMLSVEGRTGDVEGFGIAILEANALGIPAIGSKGCGIEDAINTEISGFLVNVQDAAAFQTALKTLLTHPEKFKLQARAWAEQHDWNEVIKRYINCIS